MVDFDTLESSVESSRPIEIYTIAIGVDTFRFTSHSADVAIGVNTWEAIPISRGAVGQGAEERRRTVTVTLPTDNSFAQQYLNIVPGQRTVVNIIRLQRDETPAFATQALIFKGLVASAQFTNDGNEVQLTLRSIEAAASRTIPRFTFMGLCNHVLFDNGCKVNPASFSMVGPAAAVSGNILTVTGANGQANGYWTGGWCKPNAQSDFRLILAHSGNNLTLLLPFATNVLAADIQVFAGCNHQMTGDCATKFDNVLEFGGFPFVPTKNIFATGLD